MQTKLSTAKEWLLGHLHNHKVSLSFLQHFWGIYALTLGGIPTCLARLISPATIQDFTIDINKNTAKGCITGRGLCHQEIMQTTTGKNNSCCTIWLQVQNSMKDPKSSCQQTKSIFTNLASSLKVVIKHPFLLCQVPAWISLHEMFA